MKKAIVLLMTIGFITIISALVLISLSISKKSFDQVVYLDAQNQFSVVFKDFVNILRTNSEKIKTSDDLEIFLLFSMPPLREPESEIEVGFLIESQMGKLNINYILNQIATDINGTKKEYLERPLLNFFTMSKLKEPQVLLDIIYDTFDKDDMERGAYSEIASVDFDFRQGKIYNYNHLSKIFDRYLETSRDSNIYNIDKTLWEETFYYGDINVTKQLLDCNQLDLTNSINLLTDNRYLDDILVDFCKEFKDPQDEDFKMLKNIYNISDFNKTKHYLIKCDIIFNTENFSRNVAFDYDIKNGEISNIDKNFQQ